MGGLNWQQGEAPSSGGSALIGISLTLSVLQILFVTARFYTRSLQHTQPSADDYVMLIALVCILRVDSVNVSPLMVRICRLEASPKPSSILFVSFGATHYSKEKRLTPGSGWGSRTRASCRRSCLSAPEYYSDEKGKYPPFHRVKTSLIRSTGNFRSRNA
jgi:hypothetical protein